MLLLALVLPACSATEKPGPKEGPAGAEQPGPKEGLTEFEKKILALARTAATAQQVYVRYVVEDALEGKVTLRHGGSLRYDAGAQLMHMSFAMLPLEPTAEPDAKAGAQVNDFYATAEGGVQFFMGRRSRDLAPGKLLPLVTPAGDLAPGFITTYLGLLAPHGLEPLAKLVHFEPGSTPAKPGVIWVKLTPREGIEHLLVNYFRHPASTMALALDEKTGRVAGFRQHWKVPVRGTEKAGKKEYQDRDAEAVFQNEEVAADFREQLRQDIEKAKAMPLDSSKAPVGMSVIRIPAKPAPKTDEPKAAAPKTETPPAKTEGAAPAKE